MRKQYDGEREKKNKKSFAYERNRAYMHGYYSSFVYLYIFSSTDVGVFCMKICKIEHFLYFANFYNH